MFRPSFAPAPLPESYSLSNALARLLAPFTLWICVSLSLRYGYYGDYRMVIGPCSSRLIKSSSLFVDQVEVRNEDNKGAFLYAFSEKPVLSRVTKWSSSSFLTVPSYNQKGFYLWLNKGSRIQIGWVTSSSSTNIQLVIVKGERRKHETVIPKLLSNLNKTSNGTEVEYTIDEEDKYYVGIINPNARSIVITMSVNVTARTYDVTKASNACSTSNGSCQLKLFFPDTQYLVLTTPNNGDLGGWYIELSFIARVVTYIAVLGFLIAVIFLLLKYVGAYESESTSTVSRRQASENDRIVAAAQEKTAYYGTNNEQNEDEESGLCSSSSEDLYDAKLCAICYDEHRNCFFIPCGHCATCYDCAQKIMLDENKMCPICRRLIHKARRLFSS